MTGSETQREPRSEGRAPGAGPQPTFTPAGYNGGSGVRSVIDESPPLIWVPPTNAMAILSLVFAFLFSPLGLIFGCVARTQIPETGEAGHIMSGIGILLSLIFMCVWAVMLLL